MTKRHASPNPAFTLIELLIVIAIIGILMTLLFPAVNSAIDAARKTQAKNDVTQIATAIAAYETEYGRLPGLTTATIQPIQANADASKDDDIITILGNLKANNTNNPRAIVFFEAQTARKGKGGISTNNVYVDPWGNPYIIALDGDYDNRIDVSTNGASDAATGSTNVMKKVGVWNNTPNSHRQVRSWE